MASASWHSLEPPLNEVIVSVIENEFHFEKMTPVQVSVHIHLIDHNRTSIILSLSPKTLLDLYRKRQYRC